MQKDDFAFVHENNASIARRMRPIHPGKIYAIGTWVLRWRGMPRLSKIVRVASERLRV